MPVSSLEEADDFYNRVIGLDVDDDCYVVPSKSCEMRLLAQRVDKKELNIEGRFPLFRFYYNDDLVQFCENIVKKGAKVTIFAEYPGGYFLRVKDPFGNIFEVTSDNLKRTSAADPREWDFYKRL